VTWVVDGLGRSSACAWCTQKFATARAKPEFDLNVTLRDRFVASLESLTAECHKQTLETVKHFERCVVELALRDLVAAAAAKFRPGGAVEAAHVESSAIKATSVLKAERRHWKTLLEKERGHTETLLAVGRKRIAQLRDELKAAEASKLEAQERLSQAVNCCLCLDAPKAVLFQPCGHVTTCASCAKRSDLNHCPVCQSPVTAKLPAFIS
jgi:hypothetical protein